MNNVEDREAVVKYLTLMKPEDCEIIEILLLMLDDWEIRDAVFRIRNTRG